MPSSSAQLADASSNTHQAQTVVLGGVVGNVIEWYDFALFGYFAPVISHPLLPQ